ncbi:hypothetical protein [Streptomyces sp. NPDC001348]
MSSTPTTCEVTLVQQPRYVDVADERWDENANLIANARQGIPRLIAEDRRPRRILEADERQPDGG